jgi:hypothetical protein
MNTRNKIVLAAALTAALSALNVHAADRSNSFETQMQQGDGFSTEPYQRTPARSQPGTAWDDAQTDWFNRERAAPQVVVPFNPPPVAAATTPRPASARTAAEDQWLTQERNETDGNVAPVPFPASGDPSAPGVSAADSE